MDCVFCSIIKGEIPCYKIYEDDSTLAFLDIAKEGEGHTIIVPKKHVKTLISSDMKTVERCMNTTQRILKHYIEDCGFEGANVFINNGESAGQSVPHFHVHIIPRKKEDKIEKWEITKDEKELQEVCDRLKIQPAPELKLDDNLSSVVLYTDGACSGNPGAGGFAAILQAGKHEKVISGGDANTTNNRMELLGVISGLEALKSPCDVQVYSDSAYVVNAFLEDWISFWVMNGWRTKGKTDVQNVDLWQRLIELTKKHKVTWNKVKGHADNELNNRCDAIARKEIEKNRI